MQIAGRVYLSGKHATIKHVYITNPIKRTSYQALHYVGYHDCPDGLTILERVQIGETFEIENSVMTEIFEFAHFKTQYFNDLLF